MRLRSDDGELAFITTIATFGTALDITLAELAIEAFLPADAATAAALHARFAPARRRPAELHGAAEEGGELVGFGRRRGRFDLRSERCDTVGAAEHVGDRCARADQELRQRARARGRSIDRSPSPDPTRA